MNRIKESFGVTSTGKPTMDITVETESKEETERILDEIQPGALERLRQMYTDTQHLRVAKK